MAHSSADAGGAPAAGLAAQPFVDLVQSVASADPTPGAGPSLAWVCALAAGLIEMVNAVLLKHGPPDAHVLEVNRQRANARRQLALSLADVDIDAYRRVIEAQRDRDRPGRSDRLRRAMLDAAEPIISILETAAELSRLAADAAETARGGVRGEAIAALLLSSAVADGAARVARMNLAGALDDPRHDRIRELATAAEHQRARVLGPPGGEQRESAPGTI